MVRLGIHVGSAAVVHTLLNVPHTQKHALTRLRTHALTQTWGSYVVVSICIPQICNAVKKHLGTNC